MLEAMAHYKLIACEVIRREIAACLSGCPHRIEAEYLAKAEHDRPDGLRRQLQERIDAAASGGYAAVLLGYGLCGNGTAGLVARTVPLVIPRAHDCATLFLGSRRWFERMFRNAPSTPYSSAGYADGDGETIRTGSGDKPALTLEELIARYGEEDAREIWDAMHLAPRGDGHDRLVYIAVPETDRPECLARCTQAAAAQHRTCSVVPGDLGLLRRLVHGDWNDDEFLTVPAGRGIAPAWDWDRIIRLEASDVPAPEARGLETSDVSAPTARGLEAADLPAPETGSVAASRPPR